MVFKATELEKKREKFRKKTLSLENIEAQEGGLDPLLWSSN